MAGKISELDAAAALTGAELVELVQSAANVQSDVDALKTYINPLTTKGDLSAFSTVNTRLPVGTNGQLLSADSAETTGLKWVDAPSGSLPAEGSEGDVLTVVSGAWASAAPAEVDLGALTETWDNGSTVYSPIKLTITRSAYGTNSRMLTIFDGATEKFYIDPNGLRVSNYANTGDAVVTNFNGEVKVKNSGRIGFSSAGTVNYTAGAWECAWERGGTGFMELRGASGTDGAAINLLEMGTAPATPGANSAHLYVEDNGSGKTRLVIKYATGNVAVIDTDV